MMEGNTAQFSSAGLIIRQKEPKNLETPLDVIDSYITPAELFYIRCHFPAPNLDLVSYQLRMAGEVARVPASQIEAPSASTIWHCCFRPRAGFPRPNRFFAAR
jgi:hypothetical protein